MSWSANLGFLYNSRWIDLAVTVVCVVIAAFGIYLDDELLVAFIVPAGIGVFRQFVPLLTVPYVFSIVISLLLLLIWLDVPAKLGLGGWA